MPENAQTLITCPSYFAGVRYIIPLHLRDVANHMVLAEYPGKGCVGPPSYLNRYHDLRNDGRFFHRSFAESPIQMRCASDGTAAYDTPLGDVFGCVRCQILHLYLPDFSSFFSVRVVDARREKDLRTTVNSRMIDNIHSYKNENMTHPEFNLATD